MTTQTTLFDDEGDDEAAFLAALKVVFASIAEDAGSMINSIEDLEVAQRVFAAFGDAEGAIGLTRAQLADACVGLDEDVFNRRFDVMLRLKMLVRFVDKNHHHRYVFNLASAPGLWAAERVAEHGGIDELLALLDRTKSALKNTYPDREEVLQGIVRARRLLRIAADYLTRLVTSSPVEELLTERRSHNRASLADDVNQMAETVIKAFPDLEIEAYHLIRTTQHYVEARMVLVDRLLEDRATSHDFTRLEPGKYRGAAHGASMEELAKVFADVVFDPPSAWIRPGTIADAARHMRPRPNAPSRPPRPPDPAPGADPIALVQEKAARARFRLELTVGSYFTDGAGTEVEVTHPLRTGTWPGLVGLLGALLAVDADPLVPYGIELDDQLLVDRNAGVTFMTPIVLRRLPEPSTEPTDARPRVESDLSWDEDEE